MPVDLEAVIIPQCQAILQSVAGVGQNVHPFIRVAADDAAFLKLFFDAAAGRVHGYTITRESTDTRENDVGAAMDLHMIVIRGYMGVQDQAQPSPTEILMQTEVEAIRTAFFAKRHLEDAQGNRKVFWCDRMKVRTFAHAQFSDLLCHYVELTMVVKDYPIN